MKEKMNDAGNNSFQITFGVEPTHYISRFSQTNEIISSFRSRQPVSQVYMLTGVRGAGKTVMLGHLAEEFRNEENWIVIELNPLTDLLSGFAARLYDHAFLQKYFLKAKIDLSILGIGVSIEKAVPISDMGTALERMLEIIQKQGKRVLITIDEAVNNEYVRIFAGTFQILMRQGYPVFLLMTGLYENIYDLQNEKTLTFLYRAPKLPLAPLNINAIARQYIGAFSISEAEAMHMARLTKGYSFAFQVLGFLRAKYGEKRTLEEILPEFDQYLEEYVYEKIWSELSPKDRCVMTALAQTGKARVKDIRERIQMSSNEMSTYRKRLSQKGLIDISQYGMMEIILPRLAEIIRLWTLWEEE